MPSIVTGRPTLTSFNIIVRLFYYFKVNSTGSANSVEAVIPEHPLARDQQLPAEFTSKFIQGFSLGFPNPNGDSETRNRGACQVSHQGKP